MAAGLKSSESEHDMSKDLKVWVKPPGFWHRICWHGSGDGATVFANYPRFSQAAGLGERTTAVHDGVLGSIADRRVLRRGELARQKGMGELQA
jgi:hypothetical protein